MFDNMLPTEIIKITRKLTVDVAPGHVNYAKAFWKELKQCNPQHVIGCLFMAYGGDVDTRANKKTRHNDIAKKAKELSILLKNKTSLDMIRLDSLDPDYQDGIVLISNDFPSFFNLSDALDDLVVRAKSIDIAADTLATKTIKNVRRDVFIKTLGDFINKKYGQYKYGTIANAYLLLYEKEIDINTIRRICS